MAFSHAFLGTFRMVHVDAADNMVAELLEKKAGEFGMIAVTSTPLSDPQQMPKVKKGLSTVLREDDKLLIMVKTAAALDDTPVVATSVVNIPITHRNVRSGVVYEKTLSLGDFTDKIGTIAPLIAGVWYRWLEYVVPAQTEIKLGHNLQDVRVDGAINLALELTAHA